MSEPLEQQLDAFSPTTRAGALAALWHAGRDNVAMPGSAINLHAHTFYSYNAYGYSPSKYAWLARRAGLSVAGIVDFDSLDGLTEFHEAGRLIGLKTSVSLETRVFVPEFASRVINSPGEPGIAYHMGVGFTKPVAHPFLVGARASSQRRIRDMIGRVNAFLTPVELDYERDVVPLTPDGNITERHLCEAYERKGARLFPDGEARALWWADKLGRRAGEGAELQGLIRAKTMKQGGVGYVQPDGGSFPAMAEMNAFVLEAGAIPTYAWLDGTSAGETAIEELLDVAASTGAAAINIIPDRNYRPGVKDDKLRNLQRIVEIAERRGFPIVVGTEMNAPGNKFVDSFETEELKPLLPAFARGAHIVYGHTVLQRWCGCGYLSDWARVHFATVTAKNAFFERLGCIVTPDNENVLAALPSDPAPADILSKVS